MNAPVLAKKTNSKSVVAIPPSMLENSMEHRYAGNGWAVIETHEDDWCRATNFFQNREGEWKIDSQLFLFWQKMLKSEYVTEKRPDGNWVKTINPMKIPGELITKINQLRADLASGRKVIQNTRLVNAR